MWSVPEEPSEAVIADSEICLLRWRGSGSLPHSPLKPTGQVVSRAGDIVRSKALDFLLDHAEIASEGESLWADEDSGRGPRQSPNLPGRTERRSEHEGAEEQPRSRRRRADQPG
jgi:hypothetical protein